jgi:hypothetical protein
MRSVAGVFLVLIIACDGGLAPPDRQPGISGEIHYTGVWPPSDSLYGLWLFASTTYPLDSAGVITGVLIERTILVYPSLSETLAYNVTSTAFEFTLPPGTYRYVGVIHQFRPELAVENFQVVGFIPEDGSVTVPREFVIGPSDHTGGLTLVVDFHDLPPQPFL